jgi:hypothetical protein
MKLKDFLMRVRRIRETWMLWKACRLYKEGVREAETKHKKDGYRYFLIYDPTQKRLVALTYERHKNRGDSYKYLVLRGRWKNRLTYEEMKQVSFYYTPSRWSRLPLSSHQKEEKKREFLTYFMRQQRRCDTLCHKSEGKVTKKRE